MPLRLLVAGFLLPVFLAAQLSRLGSAPPATQPESDPEQACTIEGRVTDSTTKEGLRNATLSLVSTTGDGARRVTYGAVTDATGRFWIEGIVPGSYRLTATRSGYVQAEYGSRGQGRSGTLLNLTPRQALKSLELRLRRHGVIAGRVLDEMGEPVERVQVAALRNRYVGGEWQLTVQNAATTDDLGNFRIFGLDPGRYYVRASAGAVASVASPVSLSASPPQQSYPPLYFPGTTEIAAASPVEVEAGRTTGNLAFTLAPTRAFRVHAQVQTAAGAAGNIMVMLRSRTAYVLGQPDFRMVTADAKGRVGFQGIAPGIYSLLAVGSSGEGKPVVGRVDFEVADRDETGLIVALAPGREVGGEVKTEDARELDFTLLRVTAGNPNSIALASASGTYAFGSAGDARPGEDGKFVLTRMFPDRSDVNVTGLPDGFYVKSVRFGDAEGVFESGLDLSSGASGAMSITVRGDGGTVEGTVSDKDSKPVTAATVVLVPKQESRRASSKFYKNAATDQQGRFTIKSVMPGDYRAYAWEDMEPMGWMDAALVKAVEDKGVSLTVDPSGKQQLQLTVIPTG